MDVLRFICYIDTIDLWLVFDTQQAIFLDGVVSFHKRFEIERSFLLRGQWNLIECKFLCNVLRCVQSAKKMPHQCSKSTIFDADHPAGVASSIVLCLAIPEASNFQKCKLSAAPSGVRESSDQAHLRIWFLTNRHRYCSWG